MIKSIFVSLSLLLISVTAAQAQTVVTPEDVCRQFVDFSPIYAMNYMVGGYDKAAQLKHIRENIFVRTPKLAMFEPGIIITLDALMYGKDFLDALADHQHELMAKKFGFMTGVACISDDAVGWITESDLIKLAKPEIEGIHVKY